MAGDAGSVKGEHEDEEGTREGMFPMRIVTRLTGLNPDTIRAWERRYGAIAPPRTEGNTRLFTNEDIERLILLREVVDLGHPIGQVGGLPTAALEQLRTLERSRGTQTRATDTLEPLRNDYLEAVGRFDARRGVELLHQAAAHLPAREFIFRVALPILREVGTRWSHASIGIAQEHLATVQMRNALLTYQHLHPADRGAPRIITGTPEGHRHEFGILIGALLAQLRGFDVIYLGIDLPLEELVWAARRSHPSLVLLAVAIGLRPDEGDRLNAMAKQLPDKTELWLGMPPTDTFASQSVRRFVSFEQLELALAERRG
jgi:MerR family transcriptional regulator, light-induced transcriptional regulator